MANNYQKGCSASVNYLGFAEKVLSVRVGVRSQPTPNLSQPTPNPSEEGKGKSGEMGMSEEVGVRIVRVIFRPLSDQNTDFFSIFN